MLAYPTPRFNASTILEGPSYRPLGRGSMNVYEPQPEAMTPEVKVNRHTKNGGFVGNFCKNVPRDNQFMNKHYNPLDGTPLSVPGSVGNVGDQAISMRPTMAEPKNEQLRLIMNILNGKVDMKDPGLGLSAKMVESLGGKFKSEDTVVSFADDFTNTQQTMRKQVRIDNAMKQGFSKQEAEAAYDELRTEEAKKAMFQQQSASVRLYDLLDSKLGGSQNGRVPSNDETGLSLAKGENAVAVRQSQKMNEKLDVAIAAAYGNFRRGQVVEQAMPSNIFLPSALPPFLAKARPGVPRPGFGISPRSGAFPGEIEASRAIGVSKPLAPAFPSSKMLRRFASAGLPPQVAAAEPAEVTAAIAKTKGVRRGIETSAVRAYFARLKPGARPASLKPSAAPPPPVPRTVRGRAGSL